MHGSAPNTGLQLTSTLAPDGVLTLELRDVPIPAPGPGQVVVRVEATPVNPSDLITLLPGADAAEAEYSLAGESPRVTVRLAPHIAAAFQGRFSQPLAVGLEGAGTVVAAGDDARHLLGKRVAVLSLARGLFAQYCTVAAAECLPLPEGISARDGAGLFCNPMTALAMVETLRLDGHRALIHTAGASNLGQMLVRICREDGIPLVAVVRREEQVALLRDMGATHVCNSSAPDFDRQLIRAIEETGATAAFDAIGGGDMAHRLLSAMEVVAASRLAEYSPYGSPSPKRVYVYGRLDRSPMVIRHEHYGLLWEVGAWVMPPVLEHIGPEKTAQLTGRILDNPTTTFASPYAREVSLAEVLRRDTLVACSRLATGQKYLINPTL